MRLRTQLSLSLSGLMALSFLLAVAAASWILRQRALDQVRRDQESQVQRLAAVSEQALVLKDELFLLNYLRLLAQTPGVSYAYFVDERGKILVHTMPQFVYQSLEKWEDSGRSATAIERERPVLLKDGGSGTARVGFSASYTRAVVRQAWREILPPIAAIAAGGIAASLLLGFILSAYMSRSIDGLARASRAIAAGDLSAEAPVTSGGELGELARQFNYMARQLRRLDELKADFIAIVSHDLRNPLGAVIAYTDYMLSGETGSLSPQQRQYVRTIQDQCRHLTHVVNNILDMGKLQAGQMSLVKGPVAPGPLIEKVRALFEAAAANKGVALSADVAPRLPQASADGEKTEQVLVNLVSNALKFTSQRGMVTLGARLSPEGYLLFFVKDTGCGIPPEELPRMFERFHQIDPDAQRALNIRGTGLGLAISKAFIEAMEGRIWAESQVGRGTTVWFALPRADAREAPRTVAVAPAGKGVLPGSAS